MTNYSSTPEIWTLKLDTLVVFHTIDFGKVALQNKALDLAFACPTQQTFWCRIRSDLKNICHTAGRVWGTNARTALLGVDCFCASKG